MRTFIPSVLFAAGLCTVTTAQDLDGSSLFPAPAPGFGSGSGGGAGSGPVNGPFTNLGTNPATKPGTDGWLMRELDARMQDPGPDYSLRAMFQQTHGDFMLKRERFDPMVELTGAILPNAAIQHEAGRFDLYMLEGDLEVPFTVAPDAYVEVGMFYGSRHYQAKNMVGFSDETLYQAGAHLGLGWFLQDDVLIELEIDPGFWSDWDGTLHGDDFDAYASLLTTIRYSDDLFFKAGVRYNQVYADAPVLPWLGFSWAGEAVRVDIMLPEYLEVSLWPSPDLGFLFGGVIQGDEYHVRSGAATGKQRADVHVQEVILYTGALWRMNDYTSFQTRVGAALAGDYKLDDGDPATQRVDGTLEPTFFLDVTFGIDF